MLVRSASSIRRGRIFQCRTDRDGDGGALRIEQILLAGAKAELDEGSGVGKYLRLPVIIVLEAGEGIAGGLIPLAGGFAVEIVLANQRLLNFDGAGLVDGLLATELGLDDLCDVSTLPWRPLRVADSRNLAGLCARSCVEEAREAEAFKCALVATLALVGWAWS